MLGLRLKARGCVIRVGPLRLDASQTDLGLLIVRYVSRPQLPVHDPGFKVLRIMCTQCDPSAYSTNNGNEATKALKGRGEALAAYAVNNHENVPEDSNSAFTGGGLRARAKFRQGHTPVGHGVMDGSKARGPMLDMREDSKFASGSLLASVNRVQGGNSGPVIDRDKRRSMDWN